MALGKFTAVVSHTTPFLEIYDASYSKLTLPTTTGQFPTTAGSWVSISRSGRYIAFCTLAKLFIYDMNSGAPVFVTSVTSPPAWSSLRGLAWNADDTRLAVIDNAVSPYVWIYDTTTWTAQTAPALPASAAPLCVDWSPSGDRIGFGGSGASFTFLEFDGSTMTPVTAPTTAPPASPTVFSVRGISYSPNGSHLALHVTDTRNVYLYNRTGMAICANPTTLPGNTTPSQRVLSWSADGTKLALAAGGSPAFLIYNRSADIFTNNGTAATQPTSPANAVCFARGSRKLFGSIATGSNPTLLKYDVAGNYVLDPVLASQPAASAVALDSTLNEAPITTIQRVGNVSSTDASGSSTSATMSLDSRGDDGAVVIVIMVASVSGVSSITSPSGLSWARRSVATQTFTGAPRSLEVWWAHTTGTIFENATVTFNTTGPTYTAAMCIGGSANPAAPWDTDVSLPHSGNSGTSFASTATPTGIISTTSSFGMLLCFQFAGYTAANTESAVTPGTGWTAVVSRSGGDHSGAIVDQTYSTKLTSSTIPAPSQVNFSSLIYTLDAMPGAGLTVSGAVTTQLTKAAQSASGTVTPKESGAITTHLTKLSMLASGKQTITVPGTISTALKGIAQAANGFTAQNVGAITTRLSRIAQIAHAEEREIGAITTRIAPNGIHITGQMEQIFTGTITMHLNNSVGIALLARAFEIETGTIRTNLSFAQIAQALEGEVFLEARITTHLGSAGVGISTTVKASQIIKGPIVTTLYGVHVPAEGGLMSEPGKTPWYSWRYTDS